MIMRHVCVAHFIFRANDKPTSPKQMKNTSLMLIETLFWHCKGNEAVLEKRKGVCSCEDPDTIHCPAAICKEKGAHIISK